MLIDLRMPGNALGYISMFVFNVCIYSYNKVT